MFRLRLDLLPNGTSTDAQMLGELVLTDDGTGTEDAINYRVELRTATELRRDRVTGFVPSRDPWELVRAALEALEGRTDG